MSSQLVNKLISTLRNSITAMLFMPLLLVLMGCQGTEISGSLASTTPDFSYHGSGLEAASDSFFGPRKRNTDNGSKEASTDNGSEEDSTASDQSESSQPSGLGFDSSALFLDQNQLLTVRHGPYKEAALYLVKPINEDTKVKVGITGQQGSTSYFLPDGFGILADPTSVYFKQGRIEPQIMLDHTLVRFPYFKLGISAGIGYEFTYVKTSIQSDLLDIKNEQLLQGAVTTLGVTVSTDGDAKIVPVFIGVKMRKPNQSSASYSANIGIHF